MGNYDDLIPQKQTNYSDLIPKDLTAGTVQQISGEVPTKRYFKSVGKGALKGATLQELSTEEAGTPGMKLGEHVGSILPMVVSQAIVPGSPAVTPMARAGLGGMVYGASKGAMNRKPITDQLGDIAGNSLGFMAGEKIAKGAGKVFKPFSGATNPEIQATIKVAEKSGIRPPLSTMTDSKFVQGAERMAEYSPFFGYRITKVRDNALAKFKLFADRIGKDIGPDRPPEVSGNLAKERLTQLPAQFDQTKNELYDAVMPVLKDKPVSVENTVKTLQDVIARRSGELEPSGLGKLRGLLNSLRSTKPNLALLEGGSEPAITQYGQLKVQRTNLGLMKKSWGDPASAGLQADLESVYGAMSRDLDNAASAVSPEIRAGIDAANDFNKKAMDTLQSQMYQAITSNKINPNNVYKVVIQPNNPQGVELGKELLGDNFKDIARQWWDGIVAQDFKGGAFSPIKLAKRLESYGTTVEAVFKDSPEILKQVDQIKQIAMLLSRGNKVTEGSQTAYLINTFSQIAGAIGAALGGNLKMAGSIAGVIGLEGLASKGIESNIGRKYLTTGFPTAAKYVTNTIRPVAQLGAAKSSDYLRQIFGNNQ